MIVWYDFDTKVSMLYHFYMKFEKNHLGKWFATKGQKVMSDVKKKNKSENIRYTLVPKGLLAG